MTLNANGGAKGTVGKERKLFRIERCEERDVKVCLGLCEGGGEGEGARGGGKGKW